MATADPAAANRPRRIRPRRGASLVESKELTQSLSYRGEARTGHAGGDQAITVDCLQTPKGEVTRKFIILAAFLMALAVPAAGMAAVRYDSAFEKSVTTRRFSSTSLESKSRVSSRVARSCSPVKLTTATRLVGLSSATS
jgi:hypothetical protein